MIAAALMIMFFPTPNDFETAFNPVLAKQGFELRRIRASHSNQHYDIVYMRAEDGHMFRMNMGRYNDQGKLDEFIATTMRGNGRVYPESSPSGIPMGDHSFQLSDSTHLVACADGFSVNMFDSSAERNKKFPDDPRALEAVSRLALGEMIGGCLKQDGTVAEEVTHTNQHPHTSYAPLSVIAKNSAHFPTVGDWTDRCTIQIGIHKLEFALASDAVAIDGKWTIIEAFVARRKGEWMIPTKVLKEKGVL